MYHHDKQYTHICKHLDNLDNLPDSNPINGTVYIPVVRFSSIPVSRLGHTRVEVYVELADPRTLVIGGNAMDMSEVAFRCTVLARHVADNLPSIAHNVMITTLAETVQYDEFQIDVPDEVIGYKRIKKQLYDDNFVVHGIKCINDPNILISSAIYRANPTACLWIVQRARMGMCTRRPTRRPTGQST